MMIGVLLAGEGMIIRDGVDTKLDFHVNLNLWIRSVSFKEDL